MPKTAKNRRAVSVAMLTVTIVALSSCATQSFVPNVIEAHAFTQRGIAQSDLSIDIVAAVPSPEETMELFGIDLYADGIQPVWLEVDNRNDNHVRVALLSIDNDYYSPLEIAWKYRKQFSKSSRDALERWLIRNSMPRYVPAGGSRSGFVFTHKNDGTKGFNVDVYSGRRSATFTFFVPMPGFVPDYMNVDFDGLYREEEVFVGDVANFRARLGDFPCCTTDETNEKSGDPLNVVIVGTPDAVRLALLRGRWEETEANSPVTRLARTHHFRGRPPDGTFHKARPDGSERKELRLWLAPMLVDGETVWIGHISYDMSGALFNRDIADYKIDPDVDDARMFLLQNLWYSQALRAFAITTDIPKASIDAPRSNFLGAEYFTDGGRAVLFVSEDPIAMDETQILFWSRIYAE